jgi:hypothetical protein
VNPKLFWMFQLKQGNTEVLERVWPNEINQTAVNFRNILSQRTPETIPKRAEDSQRSPRHTRAVANTYGG